MIRVSWMTCGTVTSDETGKLFSDLASTRYRAIIPSQCVDTAQFECRVISYYDVALSDTDKEFLETSDVVVFSKTARSMQLYEDLAQYLHEHTKARLVFDVCDNHFGPLPKGMHYARMVEWSHHITCNTPTMQNIIREHTGRESTVIPDPYEWEAKEGAFAYLPGIPMVLAWYGNLSNIESIYVCLPALIAVSSLVPIIFHIVTEPNDDLERMVQQLNSQYAPGLKIRLHEWSLAKTEEVVNESHAVLIPNQLSDKIATKSSNRMVEALQLGRTVLATPIPSYAPFAAWTWQGENFIQGIQWLSQQHNRIPQLIQDAQSHIREHYSPARIALLWQDAFLQSECLV